MSEGPYTVKAVQSLNTPWHIVGTEIRFSFSADADRVCAAMNAAFAAGRAAGEGEPVAWCVAYDGPGPNECRRVHSNPTMHKPEAESLAQRAGLALVPLYTHPPAVEAAPSELVEAGWAMCRQLEYYERDNEVLDRVDIELGERWRAALSKTTGSK